MLLLLGQGYVAQYLKHALPEVEIWGTSRTANPAHNVVAFDDPAVPSLVERATHILVSIPPVEGDDVVAPLLDRSLPQLKWLGYLSATSVYGNHQGAWVDETSACHPTSPSGMTRLKAEEAWQRVAERHNHPLSIFRLSGIYGPSRSVFDRLDPHHPTCIHKEGVVFSRIHVDDIVQLLLVSMKDKPGVYNVADDAPASSCEVLAYGCALMGYPAPNVIPFEDGVTTPRMADFFKDSKRVSNKAMKGLLDRHGKTLLYPTYREGLEGIKNGGNRS